MIWGGSFIFLRLSIQEFGLYALAFFRLLAASCFLIPFIAKTHLIDEVRKKPLFVVLMSLTTSLIPFLLFAYASQSLEVGTMVVINTTSPLWACFLSAMINGYRITLLQLFGMVLGLLGVILVSWEKLGIKQGAEEALAIGLAIGASVIGSFCYGLGSTIGKKMMSHINPVAMTIASIYLSCLLLTPLALFHLPETLPSLKACLSVTILGIVCTAFAYLIYFKLIREIGGEKASYVTFIQPLFGIFWGVVFFHEELTITIIAGCFTILSGVAFATGSFSIPKKNSG
jgi:drug/metabolite transporter (DMT)-like permease